MGGRAVSTPRVSTAGIDAGQRPGSTGHWPAHPAIQPPPGCCCWPARQCGITATLTGPVSPLPAASSSGMPRPWRFGCADYAEAVGRLRADRRLALTGPVEATPWDQELSPAMAAANVAVHEEAIVDLLLVDLG